MIETKESFPSNIYIGDYTYSLSRVFGHVIYKQKPLIPDFNSNQSEKANNGDANKSKIKQLLKDAIAKDIADNIK